jgi:hypothetical protein
MIQRTREAFALLIEFAQGDSASRVLSRLGSATDALELTFENLIFAGLRTTKDVQLVQSLINGLINVAKGVDGSGSGLITALSRKCPSFFSTYDQANVEGMDYLDSAKRATTERRNLLNKSLERFNRILASAKDADHMQNHIDLPRIVASYKELEFLDGIVQLCLAYAHAVDPTGKASSPLTEKDPQAVSRLAAYDHIVGPGSLFALTSAGILNDLDLQGNQVDINRDKLNSQRFEVMQACLRSTDKLFHERLYKVPPRLTAVAH